MFRAIPEGEMWKRFPQETRILSVTDVVDAMDSHRPFRPGLGIKVTLYEIEKDIGKGQRSLTAIERELAKVKRELSLVRMEWDILKKATA